MEQSTSLQTLEEDPLLMLETIRELSTKAAPDAHPLIPILEALRTYVNLKQGDYETNHDWIQRVKVQSKILKERIGCNIVPKSYQTARKLDQKKMP